MSSVFGCQVYFFTKTLSQMCFYYFCYFNASIVFIWHWYFKHEFRKALLGFNSWLISWDVSEFYSWIISRVVLKFNSWVEFQLCSEKVEKNRLFRIYFFPCSVWQTKSLSCRHVQSIEKRSFRIPWNSVRSNTKTQRRINNPFFQSLLFSLLDGFKHFWTK